MGSISSSFVVIVVNLSPVGTSEGYIVSPDRDDRYLGQDFSPIIPWPVAHRPFNFDLCATDRGEQLAKISEMAAQISETFAQISESLAEISETFAQISEPLAKISETFAKIGITG